MAKAKPQKDGAGDTNPVKYWREAIESIVIAIVLAFLFRAFEAEAFVIPTGSMAPTLQGRHKDVRCPECGYRYQGGASLDAEYQYGLVEAVTCPMCHYTLELDPHAFSHISNTGDRILVNKFAFEPPFGDPRRWDVIVFKYPYNAKQNYIKRCVGLENEEVKIHHGDIFTRGAGEEASNSEDEFKIARKPPRKIKHMLQLVHDTRYLASSLQQVGWPLNWQPHGATDAWTSADEGHTYDCADSDDVAWLHFRQYFLDYAIWDQMGQNVQNGVSALNGVTPVPVLITDFYAYNGQTRRLDPRGTMFQHADPIGMHWVGDLAMELDLEIRGESGQLNFVLIEAGRHHECVVDVATGRATLQIDGGKIPFGELPSGQVDYVTGETPIRGPGRYEIRFANVDDQLVLWVGDQPIQFDRPSTYGPTVSDRPVTGSNDPGDLHPARIGARGVDVHLRRARVLRDIYYIATNSGLGTTTDYFRFEEGGAVEHLRNPDRWRKDDLFDRRASVTFVMGKNQFFALGDNSPYSRDGRLWGDNHFVTRDMLIGKAVLIYWPHAWRIGIPGTGINLPIVPNFQGMGLIH